VGKMQFYLSVLDDKVKLPDENPSIGIILCKSKQRTIVEYALKDSHKPIGIATYQIVSQLPQELKNQLPEPEQIAKLLEGFE
ncbi:MAG: PDDEXK nuclease domain-containing protein, partial [Dolichospermum sp.]